MKVNYWKRRILQCPNGSEHKLVYAWPLKQIIARARPNSHNMHDPNVISLSMQAIFHTTSNMHLDGCYVSLVRLAGFQVVILSHPSNVEFLYATLRAFHPNARSFGVVLCPDDMRANLEIRLSSSIEHMGRLREFGATPRGQGKRLLCAPDAITFHCVIGAFSRRTNCR